MYVNDTEGAYAAPIFATGNPTLMADCERHLASILRSRRVAKDLVAQIFGNTSINGLAGMSQALRLWLNQPAQLGLTHAELKALQGALDLGSMMYAKQDERSVIDDPSVAAAYFINQIGWETVEHFAVLVLDVKHRASSVATGRLPFHRGTQSSQWHDRAKPRRCGTHAPIVESSSINGDSPAGSPDCCQTRISITARDHQPMD
jgi:hypothetical protein